MKNDLEHATSLERKMGLKLKGVFNCPSNWINNITLTLNNRSFEP